MLSLYIYIYLGKLCHSDELIVFGYLHPRCFVNRLDASRACFTHLYICNTPVPLYVNAWTNLSTMGEELRGAYCIQKRKWDSVFILLILLNFQAFFPPSFVGKACATG
jgi:hypothetical protein